METTNSNTEMLSLNSEFSEFNLQKLEERLETDPLAVGGLLDLSSTTNEGQVFNLTPCAEDYCGIDFF